MRKRIVLLAALLVVAAGFSNVFGQVTPAGAGDRDLRDSNVRGRSNELERVKRDAEKPEKSGKNKKSEAVTSEAAAPEDALAAKYSEIKDDFEQIQQSQTAIVNAYTGGEKADYKQIAELSEKINRRTIRLSANLFAPPAVSEPNGGKDTSAAKEIKAPSGIKEIIVELDNRIGSFVSNSIFQNLRTVDLEASEKARLDANRIIELSRSLSTEARKTAN